jgi:hypothetical protein
MEEEDDDGDILCACSLNIEELIILQQSVTEMYSSECRDRWSSWKAGT